MRRLTQYIKLILISIATIVCVWFLNQRLVRVQAQTPLREPVTGSCECPYDKTSNGRNCGGNSSYSRSGGIETACYLEDLADTQNPSPAPTSSIHLKFGNPTNATSEVDSANNYLMIKPQYALSYNRDTGIPNWVGWQLNSTWLGDTPRQNDFRPDASLPSNWYRVRPKDYTNSGFDRGHLTSSEDRGRTEEDNSATFLMTNIMPQSPDNNRGPWVQLEKYCRDLVEQGKELYVWAGGIGEGGTGEKGPLTTLAEGKVTIPANTWKVILVLDDPEDQVTETTRTIAVIMPNTQGIRTRKWQEYRVSVDEVEENGYNFFTEIPETTQAVIEAKVDNL